MLQSPLNLLGSWFFFTFWQSVLILGLALALGGLSRKKPFRSNVFYNFGILFSVFTPLLSTMIAAGNMGWFDPGSGIFPGGSETLLFYGGWIGLVLVFGAFLYSSRLLLEIFTSRRMIYHARPFPDRDLQEALLESAKTLQHLSLPVLFTSGEVKCPTVWCWGLHPAVLLPEKLIQNMSPEDREVIFMHELAHLARYDHIFALLIRLCGVFLFWNPLYWIALNQSDFTADQSCDLLVLSRKPGNPDRYIDVLLRLAAGGRQRPILQFLSRKEKMMQRIQFILDFGERTVSPHAISQRFWNLSVFTILFLLSLSLAFCQEKTGEKNSTGKIVFPECVEVYELGKSVPEFPAESLDMSTPQSAYAFTNKIMVSEDPEKIAKLEKYTVGSKIPEPMRRMIDNLSGDLAESLRTAEITKVLIYRDKTAMVIAELKNPHIFNSRMLEKVEGQWMNNGNGFSIYAEDLEEAFLGAVENWEKTKNAEKSATKHERSLADPFNEMGYTHLIIFSPQGNFHPKTPRQFLNKLNLGLSGTKIGTGYFQTWVENERLIAGICTYEPEKLRKVIESIPELQYKETRVLNDAVFREHRRRGQQSLPVAPEERPKVVKFEPENGATDLDPKTTRELRVTFDRDMGNSYSWCNESTGFPEITAPPRWVDKRTCALPVKLEQGYEYVLWINSENYGGFASMEGIGAEPVRYTFTTRGENLGRFKSTMIGAIKDPDQCAQELPENLLKQIRDKRAEITSAEYRVADWNIGDPNSPPKFSLFRFQGKNQWFVDISDLMKFPGKENLESRFLGGCDGEKEWAYSREKETLNFYNIREFDKIQNVDLSFLDPFSLMDLKNDEETDLKDSLRRGGIKYLGLHDYRDIKVHCFGQRASRSLFEITTEIALDAATLLPLYTRISYRNEGRIDDHLRSYEILKVNESFTKEDFQASPRESDQPKSIEKPEEGYQKFFVRINDGSGGRMSVRFNGQVGTRGISSSGLN